MTGVRRILTSEQAARAIYFDFEGCKDEAPSLLGWSFQRDDGTEHFRQRVVEPALWSAKHAVPHTGGTVRCSKMTLAGAVNRLVTIAEEQDRLIVSWARHDLKMIEQHVGDARVVRRAQARHRNALPTVRQWLQRSRPDVVLSRTWGGKHRLARYREIMGIPVPEKYDQDVAAKGIRAVRTAIARHGRYSSIPSDDSARRAWKAVLGHNRLDCRDARVIVTLAAAEYVALALGVGDACSAPSSVERSIRT